ncbi:BTAD domain-containing putative transcriptional regulator [Kitasatospora sp. NPDC050543]|uniref:AfsR/SARP family transcriptional regulator n=1 Tax=Kitasatospora sp. NPDC050543 TaxID=3364054 RepID=UPI0037A4CCC5
MLALLALQLGRVVPVDRFFELLWGDQPPAQAKAALQGHIAALRKVLGGTSFTLHTRPPGYLLTGEADDVDLCRFEALAARAEAATQDTEAATLLQQALDLWGGAALADLPDTELRQALAGQLHESWTLVLMAWAERLLRLGSGAVAVPALEQGVRADGLREPLVALLIRCLHQAGRLSDALTTYHQARERLDSELGVTPGPALRAAFAAALSDDLPVAGGAGLGTPGQEPRPAAAQPPAEPHAPVAHAPAAEATEAAGAAGAAGAGEVATPPGTTETAPDRTTAVPGTPPVRAAATARARHLPRQPAGFVGRSLESHWLDQECGPDRVGDGLAVVVGPAGVGKSATVVRWAHTAAEGFPDGRLFTDLRGFDPAGPTDQGEVLTQFLIALGVAESAVPRDPAARAALYRARTEQQRILVVLDNARSAADVIGLLPSGPHCSTVITSRNTLEDLLVTEGAALLRLDALPDGDALRLLERALTADRVQAEPAAAQRLIALCDRLPLALRIAASRLASRPSWTIADLVAELSDERTRLLTLDTQGSVSVRTALTLTYRHLSLTAARLLVLLAAHPGPEVDGHAAAALLGRELRDARRALGELASYHLLTENTPGRYGRHDLVRLFGMELYEEQPAEVRRLTTDRLMDYYLEAARQAADHLDPGIECYGEREHPPLAVPQAGDARSALAWFRPEEPAIRALVMDATADGRYERAWRLARTAESLYYGTGRLNYSLPFLRTGLRAAELSGSQQGMAVLESSCANALFGVDFSMEAVSLARQAVRRTGPSDGNTRLRALYTLALVVANFGDPQEAEQLCARATELSLTDTLPHHRAAVLCYDAAIMNMTGDNRTALVRTREVRRLLADRPAATVHLWAMMTEARALHTLGRSAAAEPLWTSVLATCQNVGFLHLQAVAEQGFADFLLDQGRPEDAAEHLRAAISLHQLHGHIADAVTERLATIESSLTH